MFVFRLLILSQFLLAATIIIGMMFSWTRAAAVQPTVINSKKIGSG